jgi:tellurite resistance protein TehA-like permease
VLLYLIFIAFIMYRFFFTHVRPTDLSPPYWINMGAMAITTVAGARLYLLAHPDAFLMPLKPYILGFTLMMWAWGTWWIPLLVVIGIWKYGISKQPLTYAPPLWSIVFPLGMYATAVQLLAQVPGLEFLSGIGSPFTWIAFGAWVLTGAGWLWSALTTARRAGGTQPLAARPAASQKLQGQGSRAGFAPDATTQNDSAPGASERATEAGARGDT